MSDLEKLCAEIERCRWKMGKTSARLEKQLGTSRRPDLSKEKRVENEIVKPILEALGWDFSTARAEQEFRINRQSIDFALKSNRRNPDPVIFVEAKKFKLLKNQSGLKRAQKQLFGYLNASKHKGEIKLLLLADGDKWVFYKPQYQDYPPDKLLFKEVSLLDESLEETSKILYEFLNIALVDDGTFDGKVENAFHAHLERQKAYDDFPKLMQSMLNHPSDELCQAIFRALKKAEPDFPDFGLDSIRSLIKSHSKSGTLAYGKPAHISDAKQRPQPKSKGRNSLSDLGIEVGSVLVLKGGTQGAIVADSKKNRVRYEGKEYSLSKLAKELLKRQWVPNGNRYWTYDGKTIEDIRKQKDG